MAPKGTPAATQAFGLVYWALMGLVVGSALKWLGRVVGWLVLLKLGVWRALIPPRMRPQGRDGTAQV